MCACVARARVHGVIGWAESGPSRTTFTTAARLTVSADRRPGNDRIGGSRGSGVQLKFQEIKNATQIVLAIT